MIILQVGDYGYRVGEGDFLNSFFDTICVRLENGEEGSRFPCIMENFCNDGYLPAEKVPQAREELKRIQEELKAFPPSMVVWDMEDHTKQPPWGDEIDESITSLSNYYVTCEGKDMIEMFFDAFDDAEEWKKPVIICFLDPRTTTYVRFVD